MSFVDLMGNVIWSDADITARTEAMVHQVVPAIEENILNRKVTAAALGQWALTADEQALLAAYTQACLAAHAEGIAARADMALLTEAMAVEGAQTRLERPVVAPVATDGGEPLNAEEVAQDAAERAAAQALIDAAAPEVLDLVARRTPAVAAEVPEAVVLVAPEAPIDDINA